MEVRPTEWLSVVACSKRWHLTGRLMVSHCQDSCPLKNLDGGLSALRLRRW